MPDSGSTLCGGVFCTQMAGFIFLCAWMFTSYFLEELFTLTCSAISPEYCSEIAVPGGPASALKDIPFAALVFGYIAIALGFIIMLIRCANLISSGSCFDLLPWISLIEALLLCATTVSLQFAIELDTPASVYHGKKFYRVHKPTSRAGRTRPSGLLIAGATLLYGIHFALTIRDYIRSLQWREQPVDILSDTTYYEEGTVIQSPTMLDELDIFRRILSNSPAGANDEMETPSSI